jgi:hypothetical protein
MTERTDAWLRIGVQRVRAIDGKEDLDTAFLAEFLEVFVK